MRTARGIFEQRSLKRIEGTDTTSVVPRLMTWPCKPRIRRVRLLYALSVGIYVRRARNNACRAESREVVCTRRANSRCESTRGWLARCQRAWADRLTSWQRAGPRPPDTSLSGGPRVSRNSFALVSCLLSSLLSVPFGVMLFRDPSQVRSDEFLQLRGCCDADDRRTILDHTGVSSDRCEEVEWLGRFM